MTRIGSRSIQLFPVLLFAGLIFFLHTERPLEQDQIRPISLQTRVGDNPARKEPHFSDSAWANTIPKQDTLFWLRSLFHLPGLSAQFEPLGIVLNISASYELYWDGHLIGVNGQVGSSAADEVHGQYYRIFLLPDSLATAGEHTLAMRLSSFDGIEVMSMGWPTVGPYLDLYKRPLILIAFLHLLAGAFLVVSVYYFFIYFISYRRQAHLWFALLCLVFALLILVEFVRYYYHYPYPYQFVRLLIITILAQLASFLLPLFLLSRFNVPHRKKIALGMAVIFALIWTARLEPDYTVIGLVAVSFISSLIVAGWALRRKLKGSWEAFVGVLACLVGVGYFGLTIFMGFGFLVVFTLLSLSIQMRDETAARDAALLRSKNLETQLLKSRIRPHFLMNTLTSLISWVEESPKVAVEFIEALAQEFEILNQISDRKSIPIAQELQLCQNHLKLMSLRREVRFKLTCTNIDPDETVPPALFHTLIENGLTHNRCNGDEVTFQLSYERGRGCKRYTLFAGGQVQETKAAKPYGTGLRYVEARLQDSYPQRWQLEQQVLNDAWQTEITIHDQAHANSNHRR